MGYVPTGWRPAAPTGSGRTYYVGHSFFGLNLHATLAYQRTIYIRRGRQSGPRLKLAGGNVCEADSRGLGGRLLAFSVLSCIEKPFGLSFPVTCAMAFEWSPGV